MADEDFPILPPPPDVNVAPAAPDRSSGVLTVTCPRCGTRNQFPEFDAIDIFVCEGCQEPVQVIEQLQ